MVDSYSKWIEIKVANSWNTGNIIETLKLWFSQFGIPKELVSDNGVQFTSTKFKSFIEKTGINHIRTAIYHQSSNGQVERYVQTIKQALRAEKLCHFDPRFTPQPRLRLHNFLLAEKFN